MTIAPPMQAQPHYPRHVNHSTKIPFLTNIYMCVYMCAYVYVCIYVCMHMCMYVW